jgi:dTDP-4-dehydrorhamnose reductase
MRLLLTGASGLLGGYLRRELARTDAEVTAWGGPRGATGMLFIDLANLDQVAAAFRAARPDVVLHAAAVSSVAVAYREPPRARQVNQVATERLAALAGDSGARLVYVSTDLVFDGERGGYRETDPAKPLSVYGRTKLAAEPAVLAAAGVVARVSLLFGPGLDGRRGFFDEQVDCIRSGRPMRLFADEWRTPLALETAAEALVCIAQSDYKGLLHLGGPERMSRHEMGTRLARHLGCSEARLLEVTRDSVEAPEPRPRDTSLDSTLWRQVFPMIAWYGYEEALRHNHLGAGAASGALSTRSNSVQRRC